MNKILLYSGLAPIVFLVLGQLIYWFMARDKNAPQNDYVDPQTMMAIGAMTISFFVTLVVWIVAIVFFQ